MMKGFPKHIATKKDVEQLMAYIGTPSATPEKMTKGLLFLNNLLNTKHYVFDRILTSSETPDGVEPDFRVLENQGANNDERHQFSFVENANAQMIKLGLTEIEVQNHITIVQGAM